MEGWALIGSNDFKLCGGGVIALRKGRITRKGLRLSAMLASFYGMSPIYGERYRRREGVSLAACGSEDGSHRA